MTPQRYEQIRSAFLSLRELPHPDRAARLDEIARNDAELRRLVESLLLDKSDFDIVLTDPAFAAAILAAGADAPHSAPIPERLGRYRILRVLGEGGMGTVYEAQEDYPRRTVALKCIRPGLPSAAALRRFELEANALARLQHPGIAQIYEAAAADTPAGRQPYFAMELVPGLPLTTFAAARDLGLHERLTLMALVADAVQHAHAKGVIHRDLKPANILVPPDAAPKVLDFGVARLVEGDLQSTLRTDLGQLVGTLPYMSPEQLEGDPAQIDTRSDIYAIGVILYELLTGRLPHDVAGRPLADAIQTLRTSEIRRLSDQPAWNGRSGRFLRGDVETIVSTALQPEKERRYPTAAALAADLRHCIAHEPISARPPSALYQLRKFARRNRVVAAGIGVAVAGLVIGFVTATTMYFRAARAEREQSRLAQVAEERRVKADARAEDARRLSAFQTSMLSGVKLERMGADIVTAMERQVRDRARLARIPDPQIDQRIADFRRGLTDVNPTELARQIMDEQLIGRALDAAKTQFKDQPLIEAALRDAAADLYTDMSLYAQAMTQLRKSLALRTAAQGADHPDTLQVSSNVAAMLVRQGRIAEGEQALIDVCARRRRVLGPDHVDCLKDLHNLAYVYRLLNKSPEAERILREVLAGRVKVLGPDHPDTLTTMNVLAMVLQGGLRLAEAEALDREILERRRRVLGEDNPATLITMHNYALVLTDQGRLEEAVPILREVTDRRRRVLGATHSNTFSSLSTYATVLSQLNRNNEAEAAFREGVDGALATLGPDHFMVIDAQEHLADFLIAIGRCEEAERILSDALPHARKAIGPANPQTIGVLAQLANACMHQGRLDEAEPLWRQSVQLCQKSVAPDSPLALRSLSGLAYVLLAQHKLAVAEPLLREALERRRKVLGENHSDTLSSKTSLAEYLTQTGQFADAEKLLLTVFDATKATNGIRRDIPADCTRALIRLYEAWNKPDDAARWRSAAPASQPK